MRRTTPSSPGPEAYDGTSPADSSPLVFIVPDHAYQVEVTLELVGDAEGGLLLFYNHKAFVGVGFTRDTIKTFQYAEEHPWAQVPIANRRVRVRLTNDRHIVTYEYSHDDVFGGFLSLKVGIYSAQTGGIVLSDFRYRAIERSMNS